MRGYSVEPIISPRVWTHVRVKLAVLVSSLVCACAASQGSIYGVDFQGDVLSNGQSVAVVEAKYGKPQRVEVGKSTGDADTTRYFYLYRGPLSGGRFIAKELDVVFSADLVAAHHYSERLTLKPVTESKSSIKSF